MAKEVEEFKTIAALPPCNGTWHVRISASYPGIFFFVPTDRKLKPLMVLPNGDMVGVENAGTYEGRPIPIIAPGGKFGMTGG